MNKAAFENLGVIALPGTEDFCKKLDLNLQKEAGINKSFLIDSEFPRFASGDGKAVIRESVRGKDIYIVADPYNYSVTYKMRGLDRAMSPDDHAHNIKRIISAINGKASRISVIMTMLYASRQDARNGRESLDCAVFMRELEQSGVSNIITFDAHNPKIVNAAPLISFDNFYPNYQMIKALIRNVKDISFNNDNMHIISPDAGGVPRCLRVAESLNLEIGMFYKRRDISTVENGGNKILRHDFLGNDLNGKDVIIIDDVIDSGGSLIDSFVELKKRGARRVFSFVTFGWFTKGSKPFDDAYEKGLFDKLFITNLVYRDPIFCQKEWVVDVDMTKYLACIIESINQNMSIHKIMDPSVKIKQLLKEYNK